MSRLKVLYDTECVLCNKEMEYYFKKDKQGLLIPVNYKADDFKIEDHPGLTKESIDIHLHAIDEEGNIYTGIDTFIEIWNRIPGHSFLAKLIDVPGIRQCADLSYDIFARKIRPRLPKRCVEAKSAR